MPDPHETRLVRPRHLKEIIAAEAAGVPFLYWLDPDGEQHLLMLGDDRPRVTVGRRATCDIPLTWDQEVSRDHALLERVGETWTVVDEISTNGSFVNGAQVRARHRLSDRDHLCFGVTHVTYREAIRAEGSESTARPPGAVGQIPLTDIQRKLLIALCRPIMKSTSTTPATNPQIAAEVHLSVDAVKAHMSKLFARFGLDDLPQNEKRNRLVVTVLASQLVVPHDF